MASAPVELDGDVDWKARCLTLEGQLIRFKSQASRIRELLAEKMQELERRVQEADAKADKAEEQVRVMEQKQVTQNIDVRQSTSALFVRIQELETACRDKDDIILKLEIQLEEQKELRAQEGEMVEKKAAKIKEWVYNKLGELEEENERLRRTHQQSMYALESLQKKLQESQTKSAVVPVTGCSSPGPAGVSGGVPQVARPSSPSVPPAPHTSMVRDHEPDGEATINFSEQDRVLETDLDKPENFILNAVDDFEEEKMDLESECALTPVSSDSLIEEQMYKKFELQRLDSSSSSSESQAKISPVERPLSPLPPEAPPSTPENRPTTPLPGTASMTLPRMKENLHSSTRRKLSPDKSPTKIPVRSVSCFPLSPARQKSEKQGRKSSTEHKLSEKMEFSVSAPEGIQKKADRSSPRGSPEKKRCESFGPQGSQNKPPTPPQHRFPSWENRIYDLAKGGIRVSENLNGMHRYSSIPVYHTAHGLYTDHSFKSLTVPVFTTIKGKASQIRNTPFTDESTDSSEEEGGVTPTSSYVPGLDPTGAPPAGPGSPASLALRKQGSPSSSGAVKRAVSMQSTSSDDYAIPPDAMSTDSDHSEPENKLLKTCAAYTTENMRRETLEKCGYLTKLGGRLKCWKRRWFVLRNGELSYYKSPEPWTLKLKFLHRSRQSDVHRKPQGRIELDGLCKIARTEGNCTFEIVTEKKTYYLTADSTSAMEEWIRVLQNVLRRYATSPLFEQAQGRPVIKGWVTKVKHGHSKRCWCVLKGRMLCYFKHQEDKVPLGVINMRDARVEEIDRSFDSDEEYETMEKGGATTHHTVCITAKDQGPTYLLINNKQEKDGWLYHLTVAAGSGMGNIGTDYEQLIGRLMDVDGDPGSDIWKHQTLCYSKESITSALTTLPSEALQTEAVKLFKSCQLFISVPLDSPAIDYHVTLAQNALQVCLTHPELQNEIYCQLIKQTSRRPQFPQQASIQGSGSTSGESTPPHSSTSPSLATRGRSSDSSKHSSSPPPHRQHPKQTLQQGGTKLQHPANATLQCWQLLSMCIPLFLPKHMFLWYLRAHLSRNADPRTEVGKYAVYCQRSLERTLRNGGREARPSRMELLSILLRNPYHHSLPVSIPVHFLNGTYQVVGFDGSTTIEEFLRTLNTEIGTRDCSLSGFALFTDDPSGREIEHCLQASVKLCDVISKWEQALREQQPGKFETTRIVRLTYKNRLYLKSMVKSETEKERLLLTYQVNEEVVNGRFPLNKELALEMAALMAQIEFGDHSSGGQSSPSQKSQVDQVLERFYPMRYKDGSDDQIKQLGQKLSTKWSGLKARSQTDCVRIYLTVARKWPFFGAKLFTGKLKGIEGQGLVWLAVQEDSISLLEYTTMRLLVTYNYKSVVTFGGCKQDFMLVVHQAVDRPMQQQQEIGTEKFLFNMSKPKILEITLLIASFINTIVRQQGLTCNGKSSTLTRTPTSPQQKPKVWDMESKEWPQIKNKHGVVGTSFYV
ncbi:pleckstrin homology domain-containing family H member 1-like isoform X2 [Branchiostoma lanceolatum]|uniref:pleckstrin homology domain-containing family H member 1-like isoform X2 n=1 Tax=Branchiostoma lanceolatum TaxID=7740 RepID=UPI003456E75C